MFSDLFFVGAYLAVLLGLGLWASRRRRSGMADYFLAGRTLTLPMFVGTLVPTFYGGALGVGEFVWRYGVTSWLVMALPYYVFAAIYALFLAGKIRVREGLTIPDHLESAYGPRAAACAGVLVFFLALPADDLLTVGLLFSYWTGSGLNAAMAVAAAAAVALILKGGLRSDVISSRIEFLLMFAGFLILFPFVFSRFGGPRHLAAVLPASHLRLGATLGFGSIVSWWLIAAWTLVDPAFHQLCAAAESPAVARRGIFVSIGFWALFDAMTTTAGLYARAALPSIPAPLLAFPELARLALPAALRGLFLAGIVSSALAGLQGRSLQAAVSLGKDAAGRFFRLPEDSHERWSRLALIVTGFAALAAAAWLPSIIGLWYAVGSCAVPGLLWPMLGSYFPSWRAAPGWAAAAMAAGPAASAVWLIFERASGLPLLGIEPMLAGLTASSLLWCGGLFAKIGRVDLRP